MFDSVHIKLEICEIKQARKETHPYKQKKLETWNFGTATRKKPYFDARLGLVQHLAAFTYVSVTDKLNVVDHRRFASFMEFPSKYKCYISASLFFLFLFLNKYFCTLYEGNPQNNPSTPHTA